MLDINASNLRRHSLPAQISAYVGNVLHAPTKLDFRLAPHNLPIFIERAYDFFDAKIVGQNCLFMLAKDEIDTAGNIAKQVRMVENSTDQIVIAGVSVLNARDRSRLIRQGVSFVVPSNQLYVPVLGMDLREYFHARKKRPADGFSPAAQAVFIHHMLRRNEHAVTPTELHFELKYSPMSIGRAFDDLVAFGLAVTEKHGRERHLQFRTERQKLLEDARTLLRSPVKKQHIIWNSTYRPSVIRSGETALAEMTDLSPPKTKVYALSATEWKDFTSNHEDQNAMFDEPDYAVEIWSYDPTGLSDIDIVDPLSLYAQFWNHQNERVSMAAEQLLERVPW